MSTNLLSWYFLDYTQEGYLPLHVAVELGNLHVTKELLNMNADVQVKATYGPKAETAFHAATRRRDIELLRLLNDQGSPVDAINVNCFNSNFLLLSLLNKILFLKNMK